jgi:uncharacterized membrane protein YkvI
LPMYLLILDLIILQKIHSAYNMKKISPVLLSTALWEILRFTLLFLLIVSASSKESASGTVEVYWILPYGAGALIIPAGLIVLMLDPVKYGGLLNLLKLGKLLEVIPSLVLLGRELSTLSVLSNSRFPLYPFVAAVVFDLVFLALLISYRLEKHPKSLNDGASSPDCGQQ